jgi:hypothetical protein
MINFVEIEGDRQHENVVDDIEKDIKENYRRPGHPIAFAGIQQIYSYYNRKIPISRIKELLSGIESYTLHREFHKQQRNISFSHFKRYQFQMDLVEVQELSQYNDNIRYLLNVIDTFTRFAFVRPLKDKKASTVLDQFKSILIEAKEKPHMIVMDKGTEFMNQQFKTFCDNQKITLVNPQANIHAAYIERFNRTLQTIMYKYMTEHETNRYIDVLPDLVKSYNNRKHRMINMSPNDAENNPETHITLNLAQAKRDSLQKQKQPQYKVGSYVRIAKQKGKFSRSYHEQTAQEIFKIYKIDLSKKIPLYHIETYNGNEQIKGGFYEFELTPVTTDIFRIEKVIKRRTIRGVRQLFVKWKGFNDTYNSWINETDVEEEF